MWQCPNCKETVPDEFEVCWNCGRVCEEPARTEAESGPESSEPEESCADQPDEEPAPALPDPSFPAISGDSMNRREVATVVSRSIALVILAQVAYFGTVLLAVVLISVLMTPFRESWFAWWHRSSMLLFTAPIFAGSVLAIIYWKKAPAIAVRMVPGTLEPVAPSFDIRDVMVVAYSTAGLFVFLGGLREFVSVLFHARLYNYSTYELSRTDGLWISTAQLALALWLILGSRGIVGAVYWMRTAGHPPFNDEPEAPWPGSPGLGGKEDLESDRE